jgi:hypothetical protein
VLPQAQITSPSRMGLGKKAQLVIVSVQGKAVCRLGKQSN